MRRGNGLVWLDPWAALAKRFQMEPRSIERQLNQRQRRTDDTSTSFNGATLN